MCMLVNPYRVTLGTNPLQNLDACSDVAEFCPIAIRISYENHRINIMGTDKTVVMILPPFK